MVEVIPAILTGDIREIQDKIARAEGVVKRVQIDIIDGQFVDNRTVDPSALEVIDTDIELDFHLMTKEPVDWVEKAARGGADRIIGQIEKMSDQIGYLGKVQELGLEAGLALDLDTPVSQLDLTILPNLDAVLLMAVKAGFSGQDFDNQVLEKIKALREIRVRDNAAYRICVDGGVLPENVGKINSAGADEVAVGKRLFEGDLEANIEKYKNG